MDRLQSELRVVIPGLARSRPKTQIASDIATSLESFLVAQGENIGQRRELADAVKPELAPWSLGTRSP
jgi:hypothetical protein